MLQLEKKNFKLKKKKEDQHSMMMDQLGTEKSCTEKYQMAVH